MSEIIAKYDLNDMQAVYVLSGDNPELVLLPEGCEYIDHDDEKEKPYTDSLLQIKLAGDTYMGGYAPGRTMRQGATTLGFKYDTQKVTNKNGQTEVITYLRDERGYKAEHHLIHKKEMKSLHSFVIFTNESKETVSLEMLESFSLGKISPFMEGDGHDELKLRRIRSVWSMEGRDEEISLEDLQLEPSWGGHAVRCERFGAVGSLPVNGFFPVMAIEDTKENIYWGASLYHNASWQMEVYRRGDYVQISGGLADREFGHWMKDIRPGDSFLTPVAALSVCRSEDKDEIFRRLSLDMMPDFLEGPEGDGRLPIVFNEYCTTWGNPSHENISSIVDTIKGKPFEYFVIDCGWFKEKDVPWDISMGDYEVSKDLFPEGLDKTVDVIRSAGMKPGIWFEIDNVGSAARAYKMEDMLLKRDGYPLTTTMRRFWDLRQQKVIDYLTDKVIGTLKKYGFSYMKIDCNDTVGIGCDGAESLGEALRQNQEASVNFIKKVKESIDGIVLENCASGGHKLEPLMMSLCSMASFSDAHECPEIPVIAANLHRVILPCQSQIWAVIREDDSLKRIAYSVTNTFLGRMCISGDVNLISDDQWKLIDEGMDFYKDASDIILSGKSYILSEGISSYRNLTGYQVVIRYLDKTLIPGREFKTPYKVLVTVHGFNDATDMKFDIQLEGAYDVARTYSYEEERITLKQTDIKTHLSYSFDDDNKAFAILLK